MLRFDRPVQFFLSKCRYMHLDSIQSFVAICIGCHKMRQMARKAEVLQSRTSCTQRVRVWSNKV